MPREKLLSGRVTNRNSILAVVCRSSSTLEFAKLQLPIPTTPPMTGCRCCTAPSKYLRSGFREIRARREHLSDRFVRSVGQCRRRHCGALPGSSSITEAEGKVCRNPQRRISRNRASGSGAEVITKQGRSASVFRFLENSRDSECVANLRVLYTRCIAITDATGRKNSNFRRSSTIRCRLKEAFRAVFELIAMQLAVLKSGNKFSASTQNSKERGKDNETAFVVQCIHAGYGQCRGSDRCEF